MGKTIKAWREKFLANENVKKNNPEVLAEVFHKIVWKKFERDIREVQTNSPNVPAVKRADNNIASSSSL